MNNDIEILLHTEEIPVVIADSNGMIVKANACFEKTFRWKSEELQGQLLTVIMPPKYQDSHSMGFSRFVTSKIRTLPEHPLNLEVVCGDGQTLLSEHTILTKQRNGEWIFIGKVIPLNVE